jgi:hypothetical protein
LLEAKAIVFIVQDELSMRQDRSSESENIKSGRSLREPTRVVLNQWSVRWDRWS